MSRSHSYITWCRWPRFTSAIHADSLYISLKCAYTYESRFTIAVNESRFTRIHMWIVWCDHRSLLQKSPIKETIFCDYVNRDSLTAIHMWIRGLMTALHMVSLTAIHCIHMWHRWHRCHMWMQSTTHFHSYITRLIHTRPDSGVRDTS